MIYASYLLLSKIAPDKFNESNKDEILGKLKMLIRDKKFQAHNALRLEGVHSDSDENSRSGKSGKSSSSSIVV